MGITGDIQCTSSYTLTGEVIPRWDCPTPVSCETPRWRFNQIWVAINPNPNLAIDPTAKCGIGCQPCNDYPVSLEYYSVPDGRERGNRWLLPDPGGLQYRSADGRIRPLGSQPQRVPEFIQYLRAACWTNSGLECFTRDLCECYPASYHIVGEDCFPGERCCMRGEANGEELEGMLPDGFAYSNNDWPMGEGGSGVICRRIDEHGPMSVTVAGPRLFNARFHRTTPCAPNMLIPCTARVAGSHCSTGYSSEPEEIRGLYYNSNINRPIFDLIRLRWNNVHIDTTSSMLSSREKAEAAVKNEVLSKITTATFINLNGIPVNFLSLDGAATHGGPVDQWRRDYNGAGMHLSNLPELTTIQGRLRQNQWCGRLPGLSDKVTVKLRLVRAFVDMSLIAYKHTIYFGTRHRLAIYPYARVHVRAECTVTATLDGVCSQGIPDLEDGGLLEIVQDDWVPDVGLPSLPRVVSKLDSNGPSIDSIVYTDAAGTTITPPAVVEWWGMLGAFSNPMTSNILDGTSLEDATTIGCRSLAEHLEGTLSGWPYVTDASPETSPVYKGSLGFYFT